MKTHTEKTLPTIQATDVVAIMEVSSSQPLVRSLPTTALTRWIQSGLEEKFLGGKVEDDACAAPLDDWCGARLGIVDRPV